MMHELPPGKNGSHPWPHPEDVPLLLIWVAARPLRVGDRSRPRIAEVVKEVVDRYGITDETRISKWLLIEIATMAVAMWITHEKRHEKGLKDHEPK